MGAAQRPGDLIEGDAAKRQPDREDPKACAYN